MVGTKKKGDAAPAPAAAPASPLPSRVSVIDEQGKGPGNRMRPGSEERGHTPLRNRSSPRQAGRSPPPSQGRGKGVDLEMGGRGGVDPASAEVHVRGAGAARGASTQWGPRKPARAR